MTNWEFGTLNLSVPIRYNLPYIFLIRLSQMLGSYYTMSSIGVGGVSTTESLSNAISLADGNSSKSGGLSTAITPAIPPRTTADEEVSEIIMCSHVINNFIDIRFTGQDDTYKPGQEPRSPGERSNNKKNASFAE